MNHPQTDEAFDLSSDREWGAFRKVPAETRELHITMLRPDEVSELASLGKRLRRLQKLTLIYGEVEAVDFLKSFSLIRALKCLLAKVKDFSGIGYCAQLTELSLGASLSVAGNLAFLRQLPHLEWLRLAGPHPSKGLDEIPPMRKLRELALYAPKWSLGLLPTICPAVESLTISQGTYPSVDFLLNLGCLRTLELAYARKLTAFEAIGSHPRLQNVELGPVIVGLRSCNQLGCSLTIERIEMTGCKNLKDIRSLRDWPSLREVKLSQCPGVPTAQTEALRASGRIVNGI